MGNFTRAYTYSTTVFHDVSVSCEQMQIALAIGEILIREGASRRFFDWFAKLEQR